MMKNKIVRLISYVLGIVVFVSSYKLEFKGILKHDKVIDNSESTSSTEYVDNTGGIENSVLETEELLNVETMIIEDDDLKTDTIEASVVMDTDIYSRNSSDSLRIRNLKINDIVYKILDYDNGYDLIKSNDIIGFVKEETLEYSDHEIEINNVYTIKNDIVVTISNLSFMNGPGDNYESIRTLKENMELEVLANVDNGWLLVLVNGEIGYVNSEYTYSILDKVKNEYPTMEIDGLSFKGIAYVTSHGLNVRRENDTEGEIIRVLDRYEGVRIIDRYDDFYFVMTNEYEFGFIYREYVNNLDGSFIIVDISRQRAYLYNDNMLNYLSFVTTGKDSTPTDIGLTYMYGRERDVVYNPNTSKDFVKFSMPFNGNEECLHDASWRSDDDFGTEIYHTKGSNGCVNMPLEMAELFYNNTYNGMKVLVHK